MRTTIRINDSLLIQAKKRAADEGRTLTSLIEDALRLIVEEPRTASRSRVELPVSAAAGGVLPGVDLNCSADLDKIMNAP